MRWIFFVRRVAQPACPHHFKKQMISRKTLADPSPRVLALLLEIVKGLSQSNQDFSCCLEKRLCLGVLNLIHVDVYAARSLTSAEVATRAQ